MHTNEGTLRAYLDGELSQPACNTVAAHLRECGACRKQLEALASRASATSGHLQALTPRGAERPAPAPIALSRLHARLSDEHSQPVSSYRPEEGGFSAMFQRMFNRKYRAVWAGLAVIVIIGLLFTLAPVQAAASEFLGLFRVRKFAIVAINPADLQDLNQIGGQIDKLLSDQVTVVKQPGETVTVASTAEASQKAGIRVRLPSALDQPKLRVQDGVDIKLQVDLARIQAILDAAGRSDIRLPQALDGSNVEFVIPPMVTAEYGSSSYGADYVMLVQLASPTVDAPAGINLAQIGEAMLQLLGLSPAEARHFARSIDWSSTLVIPMPTDAGSFRDVNVDGTQGVLIESRPQSRSMRRTQYTLLWQKNDVVYGLVWWNDATRGIEIANSLR